MALNISFSAAPAVTLDSAGVAVAAQAAMEMQVLDRAGGRQGVAAIGISATFQGAAHVQVSTPKGKQGRPPKGLGASASLDPTRVDARIT